MTPCTPGLVADDDCVAHGAPLICPHRCHLGSATCNCEDLTDRELIRARDRQIRTTNPPKRKK